MSMSQEEIEALMNESMDVGPSLDEPVVEEITDDVAMSTDDIAALIEDADTSTPDMSTMDVDSDMDDILASIDGITDNEPDEIDMSDVNIDEIPDIDMDDILASVDGMTDDAPSVGEDFASPSLDTPPLIPEAPTPTPTAPVADIAALMSEKIDSGIYPMPVEKEHKVVNQLNEVAEDSEEKATKIFDVLSFILDENAEIQKETKAMTEFIEKQTALLQSLSAKFPNVSVISENLIAAQALSESGKTIESKINEENNQIFNAMDLMQFHDINRQKIERVMAVIRKLSTYLNGIFEDDSGKPEVQIAKHISGDGTDTVDAEDLDSLIAEFGN